MLQQECKRTTCPEMKAGEWLYLCVAHGNDGTMEVKKLSSFPQTKLGTDILTLAMLCN
jgi:hypothetical protein